MTSTSSFNWQQILVETLFFVLKGLPGILPTSKGENKAFPSLFPLSPHVMLFCNSRYHWQNIKCPNFEWSLGGVWIVLFSEVMLLKISITSQQFCHQLLVLFTTLSRFTFPWVCCLMFHYYYSAKINFPWGLQRRQGLVKLY